MPHEFFIGRHKGHKERTKRFYKHTMEKLREGHITFMNPSAKRLICGKHDTAIGKNLEKVIMIGDEESR